MALSDQQVIEMMKNGQPKLALACTIYGEARGEPIEGKVAVGCVVRNRVGVGLKTYGSIIFAPWQFSCWQKKDGLENYQKTMGAARSLLQGGEVSIAPDARTLRECLFVAEGIVSGILTDRTKGATNYFTTSITPPDWAAKMILTCQIGNHLFYREPSK